MKRFLLILGLVLASTLLFADYDSGPGGETAGDTHMQRLGTLVLARYEIQTQLMAQTQLGPQVVEPAAAEVREGPAQVQARSGDCTSDCDGEPDQIQSREQSKDGSGDGTPDQDRIGSGTGRPE